MVQRGLVQSRAEASRLIESHSVTVGGAIAEKASRMVSSAEAIDVIRRPRYVSRGGEKLEHALESFDLDVNGRSVMDVGSSTGGFTDCVLQHGARRVFSIDVGTNQLHESLLGDLRVTHREGTNIRDIDPGDLPYPVSMVVADLSFISLTKVIPILVGLPTAEEGHPLPQMVLLVKPQFEAGRAEVSRARGVITDPEVRQRTVEEVSAAVRACGWTVARVDTSPITGAEGNVEFLMLVEPSSEYIGCAP